MALYDKSGKREYMDLDEIDSLFATYSRFRARVDAFEAAKKREDRRTHAICLLEGELERVRAIPDEIRYGFTSFVGVKNSELDRLERTCNRVISR